MSPRADILDQPERLWKPFWGSISLHIGLVAVVLAGIWIEKHNPREQWGDVNGGGLGSVAINVVPRIPLPTEGGAINPVAHDTESRAPEPLPRTKPQTKSAPEDLSAIPIPSRNAKKRAAEASSAPNKFRAQQKDSPNQVYSQSGQRMVSDMIGMTGGNGISVGNNSMLGTRFGGYSDLVRSKVASRWKTTDIDPRIRTANPVIVVFTIRRDGSVPGSSVRIQQSSGIAALDLSAQRAILEAAPFAPLPQEFSRNEAEIEFHFELRR